MAPRSYYGALLLLGHASAQYAEDGSCPIPDFPTRWTSEFSTHCVNDDDTTTTVFSSDDQAAWCKVSKENYWCCGLEQAVATRRSTGHLINCHTSTYFLDDDDDEVWQYPEAYRDENCPAEYEWCAPAPPAPPLSSGAIGGIALGAYLGVTGAYAAFGALNNGNAGCSGRAAWT